MKIQCATLSLIFYSCLIGDGMAKEFDGKSVISQQSMPHPEEKVISFDIGNGEKFHITHEKYFQFYSCMADLFAGGSTTEHKDESSISDEQNSESAISYYPKPGPGSLISFEQGLRSESAEKYKHNLDEVLESYNHNVILSELEEDIVPVKTPIECMDGQGLADDQACWFDLELLGPECTNDRDYGYVEGMPCVLLQFNTMYGWEPEPFSFDELPRDVQESLNIIKPGSLPVTCEGVNNVNKDDIGMTEVYPSWGFDVEHYFPYKGQPGYRAPLVMVRFINPTPTRLIRVKCKVWVKNIRDDRSSVYFELEVN